MVDVLPAHQEREAAAQHQGTANAVSLAQASAAVAASEAIESVTSPVTAIFLQPWEAKAGYLDRLRRAGADRRYAIYLEERRAYGRQAGFYLDVANFFFEQKDEPTALRVLSNLAEIGLEDTALLRVLALRLAQVGRPDLARPLCERVLALRPDEPQSYRDLALVCAALRDYQRAVDLLWQVVSRPWDGRFPQIGLIALGELNAITATCGRPLDLGRIDPRLRDNLPVDVRVVLTWDADNCDMDLWVTDPNGEKAFYGHQLTYQGGRMSEDFTQGYGPEEFLLRSAKPGTYRVQINYFGDRRQSELGPVTAKAHIITHFGQPDQQEKVLTVRLTEQKESLDIGTVEIAPAH